MACARPWADSRAGMMPSMRESSKKASMTCEQIVVKGGVWPCCDDLFVGGRLVLHAATVLHPRVLRADARVVEPRGA
eukprot:scaffold41322_cov60-Phaeocystis_antarctica.AAC.7